jgi:hypothetical protein
MGKKGFGQRSKKAMSFNFPVMEVENMDLHCMIQNLIWTLIDVTLLFLVVLPGTHAAFAFKLSHFKSFSNLGNSLASLARSESGAASIAKAKHRAAPICTLGSCSVKSASARGFRNETKGGFVTCEDRAATEFTQVDQTEESESRRRRATEEPPLGP